MALSEARVGPDWIPLPVFLPYLAFLVYASGRSNGFRCPRCHQQFFCPRWWWCDSFLIDRCRHCGLRKWAGSARRPLHQHPA